MNAGDFVATGFQGAVENVIGIGGDDEAVDWQAQTLGDKPRHDVAEIARGNGEADFAFRRAKRQTCEKIITDLRHDADPVDGVDTRQLHSIAEAMVVEEVLDDGLTVVEISLNGDVGDGRRVDGCHLAALHVRDQAMGMQNEDRSFLRMLESFNRGPARIARCGSNNVGPCAGFCQGPIHQPRQQLHGHVLECDGGAVKKFEQPQVGIKLLQGRYRLMAERAIGIDNHGFEFGIGNGTINKALGNGKGHIGKGFASEDAKFFYGERRKMLRQIQATVPGKARHHGAFKIKDGSGAPGGDVFHGPRS